MTNPFFKKATLLFSTLSVLLVFQACDPFGVRATGDDTTQNFDESDFHGLDLCVAADVSVRIDSIFSVEITCEETAMPYVETSVSGGILKIDFSRHIYDLDNMKIVVHAPSWDYFDVSGSGSVHVKDAITGNILKVNISGSGSVDATDAVFNKARLEISGSGDLELAGSADDMQCEVSGSGSVDCIDFPVKTAYLKVSGSGNMRVNVLETLDAEISGSGDIEYEGNPQVSVNISGSGKLRKI